MIAVTKKEHISAYDVPILANTFDWNICYGQFLDDFYHEQDKGSLLAKEPYIRGLDSWKASVLAATVHRLAVLNDIEIPKWVFSEVYTMNTPTYPVGVTLSDYMSYLREVSPPEFAQRNVYFGDNVLDRV